MSTALPPSSSTAELSVKQDTKSQRSHPFVRFMAGYLCYINRPALWPAVGRKIRDTLLGRIPGAEELEAMRREGAAWCAPRSMTTAEALKQLGIDEILDVAAKYADVFAESRERVAGAPVWFGTPSNLNLLYTLCHHFRPATIVECGVAHGWSSLTFLLYLREKIVGRLLSTDLPVIGQRNDKWVGIAVPEYMRPHWTIFHMADQDGLPKICNYAYPIDFVYYDSDDSASARRFAYALLWRNLKSGGVLVSDDVDENMAFAQFCKKINAEPIIIKEPGRSAEGVLIKP